MYRLNLLNCKLNISLYTNLYTIFFGKIEYYLFTIYLFIHSLK